MNTMETPIERFRRAMTDLPEDVRRILVPLGCLAVGREPVRNDVEDTGGVPIRQLYHRLTLDDLCDQMEVLATEVGVIEAILIPGVLNFLVAHLEQSADPDVESDRLDRSLRMLQRTESEMKLPVDDRTVPISDRSLNHIIEVLKEGMMRGPKFREECESLADTVQRLWDEYFPRSYWREWNEYALRQA